MFWNKYRVSLRTQVTFWFAVLFVGIAAATSVFTGHNLYQLLIRRMDQQLEELYNRCLTDYFVGKNARNLGVEFPVYDLQPDLLMAFDQHLPGFIAQVAYEPAVTDPYGSPTVFGYVDNRIYMLRRNNQDGKVYSRMINPQPHIHLIRRRLMRKRKELGNEMFFYNFFDNSGKSTASSSNYPSKLILPQPGLPVSNKNFRVLVKTFPDGAKLVSGRTLNELHTRVEHYVSDFLVIGLPILATGILIAWLISGRVASGIRKVGEAAKDIAGGNYSRRVSGNYHGQEIAELISAFNKMSANTERLLTELRGATDDVAHDLKTPLTRIRVLAEVTVRGQRDFEQWSDALGNIAEECDDMVAIINTMLEITRTESNIEHMSREIIDLRGLLCRLHDLYQPAAEERNINWQLTVPEQQILIHADRIKIQRMIGNLLDNALKFVPDSGSIHLETSCSENEVQFRVIDNGPGIPDQDKPRVFERFVRLDSSRTHRGNGLGLAMVRAVVHAHNGTITISDTPGCGATFTVTLPLAQQS